MIDGPDASVGPPRLAEASCCPRCGGGFHCGVKDETPCWCTGVTLTAALQGELRRQYRDCLCPACLKAIGATAST